MNVSWTCMLKGRVESVIVISSPLENSSLNGLARFGRMASSSCLGACIYRGLPTSAKLGFFNCLHYCGLSEKGVSA